MRKITFFITLLFLSFSVFSASNVYTLHDNTALRLDNTSKSKLLKTLPKDKNKRVIKKVIFLMMINFVKF